MKSGLLFILVFSTLILFSCKKEKTNIDPFTNGTQFDYVQDNTIVVKNDSVIVSIYTTANNAQTEVNRTIEYFGDSIAIITDDNWYPQNNTHTIRQETYYLNADGLADSSIVSINGGIGSPATYYEYYPDGYLHKTYMGNNNTNPQEYEYSDGNFFNPERQIDYYPTVAKLDLMSKGRKLDNRITGKDDKNLLKRVEFENNNNDLYYYQFDNNGYVKSMIVMDTYDGIITYLRFNYTYTFIQ